MSNEGLTKVALAAINDVFSDTSVPQSETRNALQGLVDEIDILLETLIE